MTAKQSPMGRLSMRTTLLVALLALSFGLTATSLLVVRITVQRQIDESLASDLSHSVHTFANLQRQQRETLSRSAALVADLPSLKALMTTGDTRTIQDGGAEFWKVSGSDLFALATTTGTLAAHYNRGSDLASGDVQRAFAVCVEHTGEAQTVQIGGRLFQMIVQPLYFGPISRGSLLGYVGIANAIDQRLAQEVSEASAAEVAFIADRAVVASTLAPALQARLAEALAADKAVGIGQGRDRELYLGRDRYLAALVPLVEDSAGSPMELVVLKSYNQASEFLMRVNRWIVGLGLFALALGGLIAVSIARRVTQPLESLVDGARALGRGDFGYRLGEGGTAEVMELRKAFDRMRTELLQSQTNLVETERLATIGRMASSISHDLRHYLSAMYANAEFLSLERTPQTERDELIAEVQTAVHGMTDLLDSLLIFSRTGHSLNLRRESLGAIVEGAIGMLRAHPEAREVRIEARVPPALVVMADGQKLGRAIFNLMLNACQAALRGSQAAEVALTVEQAEKWIRVQIEDSGPGIPEGIRETLFHPFVSAGKESGIGLGLTLALHIAQEHGGTVRLTQNAAARTVFVVELPAAVENEAEGIGRAAEQTDWAKTGAT